MGFWLGGYVVPVSSHLHIYQPSHQVHHVSRLGTSRCSVDFANADLTRQHRPAEVQGELTRDVGDGRHGHTDGRHPAMRRPGRPHRDRAPGQLPAGWNQWPGPAPGRFVRRPNPASGTSCATVSPETTLTAVPCRPPTPGRSPGHSTLPCATPRSAPPGSTTT
jgi:hypothetical protein